MSKLSNNRGKLVKIKKSNDKIDIIYELIDHLYPLF